jgi:hypothetical protein
MPNILNYSASLSADAVRSILKMLAVRRSMFTPFVLPGGRVTTLGEGMQAVDVKMVELKPQPGVREALVPIHREDRVLPHNLDRW